ncbi:MAG: hypothetical protein H6729_16190 [Deltaproteobacteria bacterium]|nr:hypothetical protein [Deltaproteobacteria bacterium]
MNDARRQACTINSGEPFTPVLDDARDPSAPGAWDDPSIHNFHVPCPFYFAWESDQGSPVARVTIDTRAYQPGPTVNNYHGLQTNLPIGTSYGGLDFNNPTMTPRALDLEFADFEFKAQMCPGDKASDANQFGVFHYYASFYNAQNQGGFTIAFDYGFFSHPGGGSVEPVYIQPESDLGGAQNDIFRAHFHVHSHQLGIIPDEAGVVLDTSAACTTPMSAIPWRKVRAPVGAVIRHLLATGQIKDVVLNDAKYVSGILAGPEHWGRIKTTVMVKNHTLWAKVATTAQTMGSGGIPEGKFRLASDADRRIYYANGQGGHCRYPTFEAAGVESALEIARVYNVGPESLPGADEACGGPSAENAISRAQDVGRYPEGRFRTRAEAQSWMYYSNGVDAFCRYVVPAHAGISSANAITTIYDAPPFAMRNDDFCPGADAFMPH